LFTHERVVSVDLAGKSRPAASEISQSIGFSLTLRQFNQSTTFCRLILAVLHAVHDQSLGADFNHTVTPLKRS
jgi:hypothetical protein